MTAKFLLIALPLALLAQDLPSKPTISPDTFVLGKTYVVQVKFASTNGTCGDHNLNAETTKFVVTGTGVTTTPGVKSTDPCSWSGTVAVGADATAGDLSFVIQETKTVTDVPIHVTGKAAGPIPPGLTPQVDLSWGVLPRRISADNFGGRITKLYYPIEVVIGNNSGYDLQIAAVQFKLKDRAEEKGPFPRIPNDSYYAVRTSLERNRK